jgi:N-acylneuraminate cytidylyltransferase
VKRIAIIPARGGSKRILKKNIKDFCGKPIISYVLDVIKDSNLFDVIHVSTDSVEIADTVESLGFPVDFMRDDSISDDHTSIMPVLKWVIDRYKDDDVEFDEVASIMPCAPFIEASDLLNASKLLRDNNFNNPVLAISTYSAPIEWAFKRNCDGLLDPVQPGAFAKRSQDLPVHYFDTGSFAFFPRNYIENSKGAGSDTSYIGQLVEKFKAIDIDDIDDWNYAEMVYYGMLKKKHV